MSGAFGVPAERALRRAVHGLAEKSGAAFAGDAERKKLSIRSANNQHIRLSPHPHHNNRGVIRLASQRKLVHRCKDRVDNFVSA